MEKPESIPIEIRRPASKEKNKKRLLIFLVGIAPLLMGALCCPASQSGYLSASSGPFGGTVFSDTSFSQLQMFDNHYGWALTPGAVIKTVDGGKSWLDVTPIDWEPLKHDGTPGTTDKGIENITGAKFLDANHAWIVATSRITQKDIDAQQTSVSAATTNDHGTVTVDSNKVSKLESKVYIRSTNDGGQTWITSNPLPASNIASVSLPNFIDVHEGWIELITLDNENGIFVGSVYHTVDGGVTWVLSGKTDILHFDALGRPNNPGGMQCARVCFLTADGGTSILFKSRAPVIQAKTMLTGLTIVQNCNVKGQAPECPTATRSQAAGCVVKGTEAYTGWGTGSDSTADADIDKASLFFDWRVGDGVGWQRSEFVSIPGGVPKQAKDSTVVTNPPMLAADGKGILPIQIQSDPQGDDPSRFFLHLYGMVPSPDVKNDEQYTLTDLSRTSNFAVPLVSSQHTLAIPDPYHIFVIGQEYNNGKYGDWNLYQLEGSNWVKLTVRTDATIPPTPSGHQGSMFSPALANLSFISSTEGWATNGPSLYHISIAGGVATWSKVYPPASADLPTPTGTDGSSPNTTKVIDFPHTPGQLIDAPQNPPLCEGGDPRKPIMNSGKSNPLVHTIKFVNKTNQTIWVGAGGDKQPEPGWDGKLDPGGSNSLTITTPNATKTSVRFWGRTGCTNGKCETGDCGPAPLCGGVGGIPPVSLAELAFNAYGGQVFYDVSLVDGFNLPMLITSSSGPAPDNCGAHPCADLNPSCPAGLRVFNGSGQVVACNSACNAQHTDQYCCLGAYGPGVCNPNTWPSDLNSAKFFKDAYPHAYSFAYNDSTSTYTCSDQSCDITVIFGTTT